MSFGRNLQAEGRSFRGGYESTLDGNKNDSNGNRKRSRNNNYHRNYNIHNNYWAEHGGNSNFYNIDHANNVKYDAIHNNYWAEHGGNSNFYSIDHANNVKYDALPSSLKRRKYSPFTREDNWNHYIPLPPTRSNVHTSISPICKFGCSIDDESVFMSRDEIDRCSPSRKDGIDVLHETHLRYSYCAFLQNLGMRLAFPQTTIGTAMILCHRFFVRQSHACHDRFLIATAALFLAGKSEETPCPLNNVLPASSEILHKQDFTLLSYLFPIDWFEKYHDRVLKAELLLLTTLNFELNVQHPYAPLISVLDKLDPSNTVLVNLATNLLSEGLRSSLWLQFKPLHIAAGAAYLASKCLNIDLTAYQNIWQEFEATPSIFWDVSKQLMELF